MKRKLTLSRFVSSVAIAMVMMLAGQSASAAVTITALNGTGGTGGEGYPALVDGNVKSKMGHSCFRDDVRYAYIIFKTSEPIIPTDYFLVTGTDTKSYPNRNWEDWTIYAANFASDAEAVEDAEWTVVDDRVGELLPAENCYGVDFTFNKADGATAYQYYMIKVTRAANGATDVWLQMSEFGFGTYDAFINSTPIIYTALDGTRNNTDGEGLWALFDGNDNTKWGNGLDVSSDWGKDGKGAYAIFKSSRPIAPTYYKLVTGTDNAAWNHRNWKEYRIYAIAETDESKLTRNSDAWILLDDKNVGEDVLPDKNSYTVYLTLSEENTTKYTYFKVEIASIQSGDGYMQMSELALGDAGQMALDRDKSYQTYVSAVDLSMTFQTSLKEEYQALLVKLNSASDIFEVQKCASELEALRPNISSSITAYASLASVAEVMSVHYNNHNCITGDGRKIIGDYLNETIAPNDIYPNGSYPYIMANALLNVDELNAEVRNAGAMLELYANDMTEGAIVCELHGLAGRNTNESEGYGALFDKDNETKWCTTDLNAPLYVVFVADEPITPTYYKLTTANDTGGDPGRNWKTWKIYGANFDSDEDATREADGWTLIDEKNNVGTDQLPAANFTDAYFSLSKPSATPYKYYRIEVEAVMSGEKQQMAGFEFGNEANRIMLRNDKYAEMETFDTDVMAYRAFIDDYRNSLESLKKSTSITEIGSYVNTLSSLQDKINASAELYIKYDSVYSELESVETNFSDYEHVGPWVESYINENVAPGIVFLRGTHAYIVENCQLDDDAVKAEITYLSSLIAASEDSETTRFIVLGGRGKWNDNENWAKLVDNNYETKWGCNFNELELPYAIFRSLEPVNPYFYTLNTGADTETYTGRNWKDWKIYAANFEGDGEATFDAEGWVLVDEKTNVGQNRLKPTNNTASYFGFSSETTVPYTYYMVVIEKAYSGNAQQMQELHFGTPDEFEVIKEDYKSQASEFVTDVICEQRLIEEYNEVVDGLDEIVNMEALFRARDMILNLQDSINASAASYQSYMDAVEALKNFLSENPGVQGPTLDKINTYVGDKAVEPSEDQYPRGSYTYIIEECVLNDSLLAEEIAFVESMKKALVAEGYVAGTEITSLVSDPNLAAGGEGWSQTAYSYGTYDGVSAGEFCNDKRIFDINQTLSGLKDGYYEVRINAAFRPAGDTTSTNYRAIVYANEAKIYAPAVIDEMVAKDDAVDGENCHISGSIPDKAITDIMGDTIGYVIWGVHGSTVAFNSGRYENVLVAKVTDGKLTLGFKNDGTPDYTNGKGDWASMGNTRVFYLGADENEVVNAAYDRALACQAKRAAVIGEYQAEDPNDFRHTPNFSQAERVAVAEAAASIETATTVAAKAEIQATFSGLCESINATKDAYVKSMEGSQNVYDKWADNTVLSSYDELINDVYEVQDELIMGSYSASEALAAKEALYAKWPDYLKVTNAEDMGYVEDAPFSYVVTATTSRPYLIASGFYERLDSTKCILKFEYKSESALQGSRFYFGTPSISSTQLLDADGFSAADDWKTVYFYIEPALRNWSFGDLEDVIRFDLGSNVTDGTVINVRHLQFISQKQMESESGEITYPTAIGSVAETTAPVVKGIFNLSGQRVSRAEKGIYIIDGRKVLVK
ncbi:MAG: hypothetical protein ACI4B5_05400 [Bacteroidaceae bacterium]